MSSTKRGRVRIRADNYPTPRWCVHRLLEALELPGGRWLEPCAGNGAIITAVNAIRNDVTWQAVEMRHTACNQLMKVMPADHIIEDSFFQVAGGLFGKYPVCLTNPPFSKAMEFVETCIPKAEHTVMLLRLNFLASEARSNFMRGTRPDVYVLPNRPSFTMSGKTDSIEYAWFHWHEDSAGIVRVLSSTNKIERRKK